MTTSSQLPHVLYCEKPEGLPTHQVDAVYIGYLEWLEEQLQHPTFCCHRLDKGTSGALLVASNKTEAALISEAFQHQKVEKCYLLITDKKPSQNQWLVESHIENKKNQWLSHHHSPSNAQTEFTVIKNDHPYYLVEARPKTGKTHQIRLHAKDSGISILGDTLYGGTPHARMFLHCHNITIPELSIQHSSPLPMAFENMELLSSTSFCSWLNSYERRKLLYPQWLDQGHALRLIHDEGTPLRVDQLGDTLHLGWWSDTPPTTNELQNIERLLKLIPHKHWLLRHYPRQAQNRAILAESPGLAQEWTAQENGLSFKFKKDQGLSPGLFLDQRQHRHWVYKNASQKNVLNLFCYTGGFSVAAAKGGATTVTSVDLSASYIQWTKDNFTLNDLDTASDKYKFYAMDTFEYLKYANKKNLRFDMIIVDPPSFSRNDRNVFRIDKDYAQLLQACHKILSRQGRLLFSTNYELWDTSTWFDKIKSETQKFNATTTVAPSYQMDFEVDPRQTLLKAFHIVN